MDYTAHGILQARILEWVPFPPPGDLPSPEIKPRSPALQADSLPAGPPGKPSIQERALLNLSVGPDMCMSVTLQEVITPSLIFLPLDTGI